MHKMKLTVSHIQKEASQNWVQLKDKTGDRGDSMRATWVT